MKIQSEYVEMATCCTLSLVKSRVSTLARNAPSITSVGNTGWVSVQLRFPNARATRRHCLTTATQSSLPSGWCARCKPHFRPRMGLKHRAGRVPLDGPNLNEAAPLSSMTVVARERRYTSAAASPFLELAICWTASFTWDSMAEAVCCSLDSKSSS